MRAEKEIRKWLNDRDTYKEDYDAFNLVAKGYNQAIKEMKKFLGVKDENN